MVMFVVMVTTLIVEMVEMEMTMTTVLIMTPNNWYKQNANHSPKKLLTAVCV